MNNTRRCGIDIGNCVTYFALLFETQQKIIFPIETKEKYLYLLVSKRTAETFEKKKIQTVIGLAIFNILLPLTIDLFSS